MSKKLYKAMNEQINYEFYSAYMYLAMSNDAAKKGLAGVANWFMVQYQEENQHALKFYEYMIDRDIPVELLTIDQPQKSYKTIKELFEISLKHEKFVTQKINDLSNLALESKDHATYNFLQWFVDEQVEEESSLKTIIDKIKLTGENGSGMFMIDNELSARVPEAIQTAVR
jgi:ferritin